MRKRKRKYNFRFNSSKHAATFIRKVLMRDASLSDKAMHLQLNKLYKTIDFRKDYIALEDATEVLKDDNKFFLTLPFLEKKGLITKFKTTKNVYIPVEEIEQEMLRRELCCYKDLQIFIMEKTFKNLADLKESRDKYRKKEKVYLKINGQKWYAGEYLIGRMGKVKKVMKYFLQHKELFDKKNDKRLRRSTFTKLFKYLFYNGLENFNLDDWWRGRRKPKNIK